MAIKRCLRPLNPVLLMRQKGAGPFFQDVGVACAKSVGNYYAPGQPGSMVLSDFYGLTYDPVTFELTNKLRGIGEVNTVRVAPINVPDMNGVYREIPGGQIAYPGLRIVENLIAAAGKGVTDFSGWGTNNITIDGNRAIANVVANTTWVSAVIDPPSGGDGQIHQYRLRLTIEGTARTIRISLGENPWTGQRSDVYYDYDGAPVTIDVSCPIASLSAIPEGYVDSLRLIIYPVYGGTVGDSIVLHYAQVEDVTNKDNKNPSNFTSDIEQYANQNGNTVDETTGFVTEANGALLDPIPSALVAPEAKNHVKYSEDFENAVWTSVSGLVTTPSAGISPSGKNDATHVDASTGGARTSQILNNTAAGDHPYTFSMHLKGSAAGTWGVSVRDRNLNSSSHLLPITTEWTRVSVVIPGGAGDNSIAVWPVYNNYIGSSVVEALIWGVQTEAGEHMTPYIPTLDVQVVRDKDEVIPDNANLNAEEGSIFFKVMPGEDSPMLLDGFMGLVNGLLMIDDGTNTIAAAALVDTGVESDIAMAWSAAGMKCCVNGTWSPLVPYDGSLNDGVLDLFRDAEASNQIRKLQIWDSVEEQTIDILMPAAEHWGTDFVMVVKTTTDGETFTLPCGNTGTYNANIDWGDGSNSTITAYNDADLAHTFAEAGNHTIKISGVLPWIYFNNGGDKDKVIGVLNGGSIGSLSCEGMFNGCSSLTVLDVSGFDTSSATTMGYMFRNCSNLTTLDVSGFDTSLVTNMSSMFVGCSSLTVLDVSGFDTSLVADMLYMFYACSSLTVLDVSGFDTSSATTMGYMFRNCSSLTTLDVSGFDTSLVANMSDMFRGCLNLTTLDVSGFDTSLVANLSYMFYNCSSLATLAGEVLGNADIVSNTTDMFATTTALSQASLDDILAKMYANRANYTWATPALDLSAPTAVPSGVYQDATPPTTGEEFRYKLENDPDGEGFNTWSITV